LTHIAVIVITYRRPSGLDKLLKALLQQRFDSDAGGVRMTVVVVDNDTAESALQIVRSQGPTQSMATHYVVEPEQGIPLARNRGISEIPDDAEFFCFIDDDEWPGPTWIQELLNTQRATNADCVHGAVIPVYPAGASAWLVKSRLFESWKFADQQRLGAAASNNVLISKEFVRRTGHRFDVRMKMTGGSDYLFFKEAIALGMHIAWCANASVYEDVPASRLTWRWIIQRQFRLGNTFSVSERIAGTRFGVLLWSFKGLTRMCLGAAMLPALIFSPYYGMRSIVHLVRGAGTLAGAFGHTHQGYAPAIVARDRSDRSAKQQI
jgi:succinoglycan biosynthesis protein ExoM